MGSNLLYQNPMIQCNLEEYTNISLYQLPLPLTFAILSHVDQSSSWSVYRIINCPQFQHTQRIGQDYTQCNTCSILGDCFHCWMTACRHQSEKCQAYDSFCFWNSQCQAEGIQVTGIPLISADKPFHSESAWQRGRPFHSSYAA